MSRTGSALVVVDMQNLFVELVGDRGRDVVAAVNGYVDRAVRAGDPVFFTRDVAPIELPPDDPGHSTALHGALDVRGTVVAKGPGKRGGFSGFLLATGEPPEQASGAGGLSALAGLLRDARVEAVTVVGIAADVCVAATARDAVRLGYRTTVGLDATAFVGAHPDGEPGALADLRDAGIEIAGAVG